MQTKPYTRPGCDGTIYRSEHDGKVRWAGRRYCSKECAGIARRGMIYDKAYRRREEPPPPPAATVEYVAPPYCGLLGYHVEPPAHLAAGVAQRMLRGAL